MRVPDKTPASCCDRRSTLRAVAIEGICTALAASNVLAASHAARQIRLRRARFCRRDIIVTVRLYTPSLLDNLVLSIIDEKPRHGFGVAKELQGDESLSALINVRRPLIYRSLNSLRDGGLIRESKTEAGDQGSQRTVYKATIRGSRMTKAWLSSTVDHPRDARLELLAKFVLRTRRGLSNRSLATKQRSEFLKIASDLNQAVKLASPDARLVALWRYESVNAMIRLLNSVAA